MGSRSIFPDFLPPCSGWAEYGEALPSGAAIRIFVGSAGFLPGEASCPLAQLAERLTLTQKVLGSIPRGAM